MTVTTVPALQETLDTALEELAQDAHDYLQKLKRLRATPAGDEAYQDAQVDLEVAITVLMAHSTSANDLLDELDDG